ncbi:MAG: hypothetical protein KKF24_07400, partial [Gammaproteobacteria bacterium]|nr:hypothetical protein [Gammaproteobacteria bacterium]MBU1832506.1 hypothetical protein [Gammaproteobacteria bacterium]
DAQVYGVAENVIFTRAVAHHGDREQAIAAATGNFACMESGMFEVMRRDFRTGQALKDIEFNAGVGSNE